MLNKDYEAIIEELTDWLRVKITDAGCKGAVVGLSGGIDSSVTAVLCKKAFPENTLGLILPCKSNPQDKKDAVKIAERFDIDYQVHDLEKTFQTLYKEIGNPKTENKLAVANLKPRLRMTTLYYYANLQDSLVVGTDNLSELKLGYFTKYGDGGIDIAPLGGLVKTEVREIARLLGIPSEIINKPPSAGLWAGQTDEQELGLSYEDIDRYILTGEAPEEVQKIVDRREKQHSHKLESPPIFKP